MLLSLLILLPLCGIVIIFIFNTEKNDLISDTNEVLVKNKNNVISLKDKNNEINVANDKLLKITALVVTVVDLFLSLVI
jgi:hypothetical protein